MAGLESGSNGNGSGGIPTRGPHEAQAYIEALTSLDRAALAEAEGQLTVAAELEAEARERLTASNKPLEEGGHLSHEAWFLEGQLSNLSGADARASRHRRTEVVRTLERSPEIIEELDGPPRDFAIHAQTHEPVRGQETLLDASAHGTSPVPPTNLETEVQSDGLGEQLQIPNSTIIAREGMVEAHAQPLKAEIVRTGRGGMNLGRLAAAKALGIPRA